MKRGTKILHNAFFGVMIVCALLHLFDGNFSAFCGWFVAACWFAVAEMRREENAQLRSRIRELESEVTSDGEQSC